MRNLTLAVGMAAMLTVSACGQTTTSRTLSAGALAAAGGAALGAIAGDAALGAVAGAGVGIVGGFLYDQYEKGNID